MAEVAREHGWHPPKSLDSDENFKPEHTLFCRELRFVAIYALFGELWAKKEPFWVKNSVSWARSELLHGIYCIFAITRKNDAFDAKIVNMRLTKIFIAIFVPDERLPSSATLVAGTCLQSRWTLLMWKWLVCLSASRLLYLSFIWRKTASSECLFSSITISKKLFLVQKKSIHFAANCAKQSKVVACDVSKDHRL